MAAIRSHARRVTAAALALMASVVCGAAQTPAQQKDLLRFESNAPAVILWSVKAAKAADFEALWADIQALMKKSERPDVKEFAATFGPLGKVASTAPPGAPVQYLLQLPAPSTTQSYNPGRIIYEFLYRQVGGRPAISRAEADSAFSKIGSNLTNMFDDIAVFQKIR
jgi:hypothetical protein